MKTKNKEWSSKRTSVPTNSKEDRKKFAKASNKKKRKCSKSEPPYWKKSILYKKTLRNKNNKSLIQKLKILIIHSKFISLNYY